MAVRLAQLKLANLEEMDPRIEAMFQQHLSRVAADCLSRPNDETARKIKLEFEIIPVADPSDPSTCDQVTLSVSGESSIPKYRTRTFRLEPSKAGFRFNQDVPEELDQHTIFSKDD